METLVFGHKNPDADSIASAIGYAWWANETGQGAHVPCRLGAPNAETQWALDRLGLESPRLMTHVRMTASDAMNLEVYTATPSTPMRDVGASITEHGFRAVPVIDGGLVVGIVSQRELARRYLEEAEITSFGQSPTTVASLATSIEGEIVLGDGAKEVSGRVLIGAMEPQTMETYVDPGDVVIIGDRVRGQQVSIERGAACLVLTGGFSPSDEVLAAARAAATAILTTPHDTYRTARRMNLSVPAAAIMDRQPLIVSPEDLLSDVRADLITSVHREALVCDESGALLGLVSRTDLARAGPKSVVLVDHSESSQSAEGIHEARVLAIVDHHRLGDVESAEPITVMARPVGATSSMVASLMRDARLTPPAPIAGMLLAAIISDTLLLRSPTTADLDREMATWLASIAGLEPERFGLEMFKSRSDAEAFDPDRAVRGDMKAYNFSGQRVSISQLETIDSDAVLERREELVASLDRLLAERELDLAILMVTDVVREGSVLVSAGRTRAVERAFELNGDAGRFLEGVLSRKKQVAAVLARSLGGP